ncbi:hypothetical protein Dimus_005952 [Dionaea muscipula]
MPNQGSARMGSPNSTFLSPLEPLPHSTPHVLGTSFYWQKAVADDVADDVADTSVKATVVKVADVATKIVHTPKTLVTMTDKDLDVLVDKIVVDVGVMDVAGMDVPK